VADLLAADLKLTDPSLVANDFRWLRSLVDGAVLPEDPRLLLEKAPPRPVIIGSNKIEFGPGPGGVNWDKELPAMFEEGAGRARQVYLPGTVDPRLGVPENQLWTDRIFRCPAGRTAMLLAKRGAPVWRYEFDLAQGGGLSFHSAEIAYVMNPIDIGGGVTLQAYWTNFAKSGDPNGARLPGWRRFETGTRRYALFDSHGVTEGTKLREPICSMLEAL